MRTTIAFRVAAALALVTGMTAAGATAAWANSDGLGLPDLPIGCSVPLVDNLCPDDENPSTPSPAPTPTESEDTDSSGGGPSSGGDTPPAATAPAEPAPAPAAPAPAAPAPAAPAPAAGAQSAPSSASPQSGSASSSDSSSNSAAASSDVPETVTAEPAVPVAPQGPVLTQVQSQAATRALKEARETLPTTVEPNTRLLAGNTSSNGALIPSPDDSGLLALIVAMAVASAGCAAAAVVLRKRSRPRHVARPAGRA